MASSLLTPTLLLLLALACSCEAARPMTTSGLTTPKDKLTRGYPYAIAPLLTPIIHSRSDENEAELPAKAYVTKVLSSRDKDTGSFLKKSSLLKKQKLPFRRLEATRRQGLEDSERRLNAYREPKYRNFEDLESVFKPRRYDLNGEYEYDYPPKRPLVSPRDPYLSPSHEPSDVFYPTVPKLKSYTASYGQRIRDGPSYTSDTYSSYDHPSSSYGSSHYNYGYDEDYTIESNKPITGEIRKRLLDYAGASDMYEGEPDYLQRIARNKNKYGYIGNDYHYGQYRSYGNGISYLERKADTVRI